MGFVSVLGDCYVCRKPFTFHPHKVPSTRVNGVREPICRECIEMVNEKRKAIGSPLIEVLPGAYDPADESDQGDDDDG
jgi:hypothetical protein